MKSIKLLFCALVMANITSTYALSLDSPDGTIVVDIQTATQLSYSVSQDGVEVLSRSPISMSISGGEVWGVGISDFESYLSVVDTLIATPLYTASEIRDNYKNLRVDCGGWGVEFRAYNDGVAYRFLSHKGGEYEVLSEQAEFNFPNDAIATAPYVQLPGDLESQLSQSFENTYTTAPLSQLDRNRLMFLPLSVEVAPERRVTITESDLRDYPGMYLTSVVGQDRLSGYFAPLRDEVEEHSGYNNLQVTVLSRHSYLAEVEGARSFPWRVAIITRSDKELASSSIVYKLAEPNVIGDLSWIKPGKVAWDWWNNWNLEGVDFEAGINNETYKYYIDFASEYGIEYVILDEGWSVNKRYDLMQVVPEIDIEELRAYGEQRGVGIILWAGYYPFDIAMEQVCSHYSAMGVKGFKVDFMNGDDQELVDFNERTAKMCAKYKLLVDIHGTYKPTGLERTYPNILNFEGVHGLEQMKWQPQGVDQVVYDVTMPYIRMVAGPVDYTQGAMNNAVRAYNSLKDEIEDQYFPSFTRPMSQGTRVHQLAMYVVFFSPLNMLCDTPTNYEANPLSTSFIASVPTVWDETKVVEGRVGEYIVTARRSGDRWYIGGLNDWSIREVTLNLAQIVGTKSLKGRGVLYKDGLNAAMNGADFQCVEVDLSRDITIEMAAGGGFVLVF